MTLLIGILVVLGLLVVAAKVLHPWLANTAWPRLRTLAAGPGRHRAPVHPVAAVRRPAGAGRRAR